MLTNVAQPLSVDPGAEPVIQRRAMKSALNPPNHSVVRPNLLLGRSIRRAQRKASHKAQNAKTTVTNVAQPLSFDPDAEPVIRRRAIMRTLNPPNPSVARPNLLRGRSVRIAPALTALNSGSPIIFKSPELPLYTAPSVSLVIRMIAGDKRRMAADKRRGTRISGVFSIGVHRRMDHFKVLCGKPRLKVKHC